jgi:hypothetical protein
MSRSSTAGSNGRHHLQRRSGRPSVSREVGDEPWRAPSVPIDVLSNQPEYEVREAALEVEDEDHLVRLWYRHFYAMDAVDIIVVTNR